MNKIINNIRKILGIITGLSIISIVSTSLYYMFSNIEILSYRAEIIENIIYTSGLIGLCSGYFLIYLEDIIDLFKRKKDE